ncbi:MAG: hypothetical protein J0I20_33455 [Chloroflexi bacterium]|nr:hypothetical protein [Chloroflexota bacterium]OJV91464.1 MAG: hypothetical protein BGO39_21715 [Chloroflexi bacterium 54-19]
MDFSTRNKHVIAQALQNLGLNKADLREVPPLEAKAILKTIKDHFCTRQNARWWWEYFRTNLPQYSHGLREAYLLLEHIIPVKTENVWFVVEEDNSNGFRLFSGTVSNIQKVIGESSYFEYYLVAFDFRWLICETHHNNLIAVGDEVVAKFKDLMGNRKIPNVMDD